MRRSVLALWISVVVLSATSAPAATLSGSFAYDGQALSTVFPDYDFARVGAWDAIEQEWIIGVVDLASGTYQITDLEQGDWFVRLIIGPDARGGTWFPLPGELTDFQNINLSGPQEDLDFALRYAYRITEPYESSWPGPISTCPYGPTAPAQFTFSWDPVPRAVSYTVLVESWSCDGEISTTIVNTEDTSVQVVQGAVAGETYLSLMIRADSQQGLNLAQRPWLEYEDGNSEGAFIQMGGGGGGGRVPHPTSSVFVPQVARLPGVAPSFWTSDVVLTNPTSMAVDASLIFTERNADGMTDYLEETVQIPAGGCRVLQDVVGNTFSTSGAGWLEVSPLSLRVTSRISTPGTSGGSYGQGFPALPADAAASTAGPVTTLIAGGVIRGAFRSNLVLTEIWGENATVEVTVFDRTGLELGSARVSLLPFSTTQLNDVVARVNGPSSLEEGQVTVEVVNGQGRVVSVLSLVDQQTGDPTTLVLQAQ